MNVSSPLHDNCIAQVQANDHQSRLLNDMYLRKARCAASIDRQGSQVGKLYVDADIDVSLASNHRFNLVTW